MTRTIAYVRVSTSKQADNGISLDAQQAKVKAYAELYDLDLVEVIVDAGASAKSMDRPGLARALAMLKNRQAEALLVVKLDRLTRSIRDLGEIIDRCNREGWALLSVSEQVDTRSAAGRLVLNVLGAVSAWEREAIGERTSAVMRHMRSNGEFTGGHAPYGYTLTDDGVLVESSTEQRVLAEARRLRGAGLSLRAVGAELAKLGMLARNGRVFDAVQVSRMVAA